MTCFTGEKFVTGQQRFAPWYVYHKGVATHPVTNFSPEKQVNISNPWYKRHDGFIGENLKEILSRHKKYG